ncbi:MAG: squalene/phytoene synthase family protein [Planctomycetes bacterium]|nr:squalene/phytoene synthase family protein [Planctomycetota bacterium]
MSAAGEPIAARLAPGEVLARARSNFAAGFVCLPADRRAGMTAVYAFCRAADDAVDDAPDPATAQQHLQFWRHELAAAAAGAARTPIGSALAAAMQRFGPFQVPLDALLDGMAMDIGHFVCRDEAELRTYCWRVASAVGRACLPVLGASGPAAEAFADHLGLALQFTNILRDLRSDAGAGRCYVPSEWLAALQIDRAWLAGDGPAHAYAANGPLAALAARFAAAARTEFAAAAAALQALPKPARRALVPARIMGAVYGELLVRLERRGGELRGPRVRVPKPRRLWLAAGVLGGWRR